MNPFEPPVVEIRRKTEGPARRSGMLGRDAALTFLLLGTIFLFYFIVPKFEAIYIDFGSPLPRITIFAIELSHLVIKFVYLFVPGVLWLLWFERSTRRRSEDDPTYHKLSRGIAALLWFLSFATLIFVVIAVGIPLLTINHKLSG